MDYRFVRLHRVKRGRALSRETQIRDHCPAPLGEGRFNGDGRPRLSGTDLRRTVRQV